MRSNRNEPRVLNPFGGGSTQSFPNSGTVQPNPFYQPARLNAQHVATNSHRGKGKSKGNTSSSSVCGMQDEIGVDSPRGRISNPFAVGAGNPVSLEVAVSQFKSEYLKKKGYPFSCFGEPDEVPVIHGDISPEELRFYLTQGSETIRKAIQDRSDLLNTDLHYFVRWASNDGSSLQISRIGPYRVPDAEFPSFVPRAPFPIAPLNFHIEPSSQDLEIFKSSTLLSGVEIPTCVPPLHLR